MPTHISIFGMTVLSTFYGLGPVVHVTDVAVLAVTVHGTPSILRDETPSAFFLSLSPVKVIESPPLIVPNFLEMEVKNGVSASLYKTWLVKVVISV